MKPPKTLGEAMEEDCSRAAAKELEKRYKEWREYMDRRESKARRLYNKFIFNRE